MTVRPCIEPDCPNLTTGTRCAVHQKEANAAKQRRGLAGRPTWPGTRRQVLKRDGWRCTSCGSPFSLHVHHRNGNRNDDRMENLVTLCSHCHTGVHASA